MCDEEKIKLKELKVLAIIGFDGHIPGGLRPHPDQKHLIFPLGNKISILNIETNKQTFLVGHTHTVSNVEISASGKLIASGQINHMGFRALVIIWDWESQKEFTRHELHKVRVEALIFTADEHFLVTLGGKDCKMIYVWDIDKDAAFCGAVSIRETTGDATRLARLHRRGAAFLSGGKENLRIWTIDIINRKLIVEDVIVGKLRREYTAIRINTRDEVAYVGTMSGDVVKIRLNCHHDPDVIQREKSPVLLGCFARHNPKKPVGKDCEKYTNGVRDLLILPSGNLIVGAGDGTIELLEERSVNNREYPYPTWPQFKLLKTCKTVGAITTLNFVTCDLIYIGTETCEIYSLKLSTFELKLLKTCHTSTVYDIAFPHNFSVVFATASYQSIRIWSTTKMQELLRIQVPNFTCASLVFTKSGKSIISAWNDGIIRAFTPMTGNLIYAIQNAHNKGCSAVTVSTSGRVLVSGGVEGQIRVWKIEASKQSLVGVLKEHVGPVSSVHFNCFDTEVISASTDGTCIIWDIQRLVRKNVLFANTQFTCARYFPTGVHILATGSDRRISYWEAYDGSLIRDVEGTAKGTINCIDLSENGDYFVSVGNDQIVRFWDYQEGKPLCAGYGHAGFVTVGKISPCGRFMVTGSADGGVFIWKIPNDYVKKESGKDSPKSIKSAASSCKSNKSTKKKKKSSVCDENIIKLESSRSDKEVLCTECPVVQQEVKSATSKSSIRSGKKSSK